MEKCPFWSMNGKVESCDKECPMCKSGDECVFQLYNSENLEIVEENE
ncbi:MAG: hypothetical protein ACRCTZ_10840 [Sarcina sp.]